MDNDQTNNETFQNEHPAAPLAPVETGLPQGASHSGTTQNQPTAPKKPKAPTVKQFEDGKTPQDSLAAKALDQEPAKYQLCDFMSQPSFVKYSRHLSRVEDIVSKLGFKMRVPKLDRSFVPYVETITYDGANPNFGPAYSITPTRQQPNPYGANHFRDPAWNAPFETRNTDVIHSDVTILDSNRDVIVKWNSDVTQVLLTAISTNRWDWLKNGTRQNRAAAQATVTDITTLFTKDLDISHGTLDTAMVAAWMYGTYNPDPDDPPIVHVININDLATYMNTSPNQIIANKTPLLNLSTNHNATPLADNILAKTIVFKPQNNIIVNIGAPVDAQDDYLGCPCRDIVCNQVVNRLDQDIANVLDNTLDEQTVEFAFWLNLQHLPYNTYQRVAAANTLTVFRADFQDQLIRYHSRPEPSLGIFNSNTIPLYQVVFTYRCLKTILLLLALKQYGITPGFASVTTSGRTIDAELFRNKYLGMWYYPDYNPNEQANRFSPVWIPYEFVNNNAQSGWKIELDDTTTVFGSRLAFGKYKWPRSIKTLLANNTYLNINLAADCPDANSIRDVGFSWAIPLTTRNATSNNHIQSVSPSTYDHNSLFRVANSAWIETTHDNHVVEELSF